MTHKHYRYYLLFLVFLTAFNLVGQFLSFLVLRSDCNSRLDSVPVIVSNLVSSISISRQPEPVLSSVSDDSFTPSSRPSPPSPVLLGSFLSSGFRVADYQLADGSTLRLYCPTNPTPSQFRSILSQFRSARLQAETNYLNPNPNTDL